MQIAEQEKYCEAKQWKKKKKRLLVACILPFNIGQQF